MPDKLVNFEDIKPKSPELIDFEDIKPEEKPPEGYDPLSLSLQTLPSNIPGYNLPLPLQRMLAQAGYGVVDEGTLGLAPLVDQMTTGGQFEEAFKPANFGERMARRSGEFAGFVFGLPVKLGRKATEALITSGPGKQFAETFAKRVGGKAVSWLQEGLGLGVASAMTDIDGLVDAYTDDETWGITDTLIDRGEKFLMGTITGARFGAVRDLIGNYGMRAFTNLAISNMLAVGLNGENVDPEEILFNSLMDLWFSRNPKPPTPEQRSELREYTKGMIGDNTQYRVVDALKDVVGKYKKVKMPGESPEEVARKAQIRELEKAPMLSQEEYMNLKALKNTEARVSEFERFADMKITAEDRYRWAAVNGDGMIEEGIAYHNKKFKYLSGKAREVFEQSGQADIAMLEQANKHAMAETLLNQLSGKDPTYKKFRDEVLKFRGEGPKVENIKLYHGTSELFDKFSMEQIGTGEGAQAFGWGLYFTDSKGIAEFYAKYVTESKDWPNTTKRIYQNEKDQNLIVKPDKGLSNVTVPGDLRASLTIEALRLNTPKEKAINQAIEQMLTGKYNLFYNTRLAELMRSYERLKELRNKAVIGTVERVPKSPTSGILEDYKHNMVDFEKRHGEEWDRVSARAEPILNQFRSVRDKIAKDVEALYDKYSTGRPHIMYTTNITPQDPAGFKWLDWDKPMSPEQRDMLVKTLRDRADFSINLAEYNRYADEFQFGVTLKGEDVYRGLADTFTKPKVSKILSEAGIDGIRYPANSLSGKADPTKKNYVLFRDDAIKIIERKYVNTGKILPVEGIPSKADIFKANQTSFFPEITTGERVYNNVKAYFTDPNILTSEYIDLLDKHLVESADYTNNVGKAIQEIFGVQSAFKGIATGKLEDGSPIYTDAPQTGIAVKNFYSLKEAIRNQAAGELKRVARDLNFSEDLMRKLVLAHEVPEYINELPIEQQAPLRMAAKRIKNYFDSNLDRLKSLGVLEQGYKEAMLEKLQEKLAKAGDPAEAAKVRESIDKVKNMNFEHIPINLWFDRMADVDMVKFNKVLNYLTTKDRKVLRIYDLYKAGVLRLEDIHIRDVLTSYGSKLGNDIALGQIVQAAIGEGLAVPKSREGKVYSNWTRPHNAPILKGFKVHPMLNKWIESMSGYQYSRNLLVRGANLGWSSLKMAAFYNPAILPFYDTVQGTMLGSFVAPGIPKIKPFRDALKDWRTDSVEWRLAEENGVASKPYGNPFDTYVEQMTRITDPGAKALQGVSPANDLYKYAKDFLQHLTARKGLAESRQKLFGLSDLYTASWEMAWMGDRFIRQISYRHLRDKGYSPQDAAQIAAMFHGDYASVPQQTREMMNKVFFTPTFKIAMAKLYGNMVRGAIKSAAGTGDATDRRYGYGLFKMGAIVFGFDLLMTGLGFRRDEFGVKYVHEYDSPEGPKEFVLHMSNPANLAIKYFNKAVNIAHGRQGTWVSRSLRQFWSETHPGIQIPSMLIENKDREGEPIVNEFDPWWEAAIKQASFVVKEAAPILKTPFTSDKEYETNKAAEEVLKTWEIILRPITYKYSRDPKYMRFIKEMQRVGQQYEHEVKSGYADEESAGVLIQRFEDIRQDLERELEGRNEWAKENEIPTIKGREQE